MTASTDPAPSDLRDWGDAPHRPTRCQCGGDMPGRCPGPASCPICAIEPACRVCGFPTQHRQDADDTWICKRCEPGDGDDA